VPLVSSHVTWYGHMYQMEIRQLRGSLPYHDYNYVLHLGKLENFEVLFLDSNFNTA
jgi:hypothetical protein